MRSHSLRLSLIVVGVFCFAAAGRAEEKTAIGRLAGAQSSQQYHERPRIVLTVETIDGKQLQIGVENTDEKAYKVDPKAALLSEIKALNPGDIVKVVYATETDNTLMLASIAAYTMQPGMELPNAFIFHESYDHTDNQKNMTLVDVKRFDQVVTFMVFGKKDAAGNVTPDPDLMAALGKLKDGQVVLADIAPATPYPILRGIEAYTTPQTGTLKAIKIADLNGNKTTEADIDVNGSPLVTYVPGHLDGKRWIVDAKVLAQLRRLRSNTLVLFRVVDDGSGNSLLRDIKQAPKEKTTPKLGSSGSSK